jgi:hypothetical protein
MESMSVRGSCAGVFVGSIPSRRRDASARLQAIQSLPQPLPTGLDVGQLRRQSRRGRQPEPLVLSRIGLFRLGY